MNKHLTLITLALILIALIACGATSQAATLPAFQLQPTTIQDPLLLKGWNLLNHHTEPVRLWDGRTLSGHDLAQFVLDHAIPIVWNTQGVCGGASCSLQYCQGDLCTHMADLPGVEPIYISLSIRTKVEGQMEDLVDTLAHEIFHYTQAYGPVMNTLYEEFTAYHIGAQISKNSWTNFEDYDPLQPACLEKWFYDTRLLEGYQHFKAYPLSMMPSVDTSSTTCRPKEDSLSQAAPKSLVTCMLSMDGSASCQFPPPPTPTPEYQRECTTDSYGLESCKTIWLNEISVAMATPSLP